MNKPSDRFVLLRTTQVLANPKETIASTCHSGRIAMRDQIEAAIEGGLSKTEKIALQQIRQDIQDQIAKTGQEILKERQETLEYQAMVWGLEKSA